MSAPTRADYEIGVASMVDHHPQCSSPDERYDRATSAMEGAGFTATELRGMLAVAVDRLSRDALAGEK